MGQRLERISGSTDQNGNTASSNTHNNQTTPTQINAQSQINTSITSPSSLPSTSYDNSRHNHNHHHHRQHQHQQQQHNFNSNHEAFMRFLQARHDNKNTAQSNNLHLFNFSNTSTSRLHNNNTNHQNNDEDDDDFSNSDDDFETSRSLNALTHAFPLFMSLRDFKCLVCNKLIPADDIETHLTICLTRPRKIYNDDVLTEDRDECIICLENLEKGQQIARLTCLCIYHKHCIDAWLRVNPSCPSHPPD